MAAWPAASIGMAALVVKLIQKTLALVNEFLYTSQVLCNPDWVILHFWFNANQGSEDVRGCDTPGRFATAARREFPRS